MLLVGWFLVISLLIRVSPGACSGEAKSLQHKRALTDKSVVNDNLGGYTLFNMTVPQVQGYLPVDAPCNKPSDMPDDARLYQYSIYTSDCAQPWRLCLSERSGVSLQQAIQSIIGTAVGIRRYIDTYYFIERTWDPNLDNGESIQATARDIWSFGINDYQHFNSMAFQITYRDVAASSDWKRAVDSDSCVVSPESRMSYERAFGQAAMIRIFQIYNGFLPKNRDWSCMQNQLNFLVGYINASIKSNTCGIPGDGGKALKSSGPTSLTPLSTGFFGQSSYPTLSVETGGTPSATAFTRLTAPPGQPAQKNADSAQTTTDSPDTSDSTISDSPDSPDVPVDEQKATPTPTPTPSLASPSSKSITRSKEDARPETKMSPSATRTKLPGQTAASSSEVTSSSNAAASQDGSPPRQESTSESEPASSKSSDSEPPSSSATAVAAAFSAQGAFTLTIGSGQVRAGVGPATANQGPSMYTTIVFNYDLNDPNLYSGAVQRLRRANCVYLFTVMIGFYLSVLL